MNALANTIRVTLLIVLLITPWLFGGVWASVQWVLMLVLAVLLALELVSRFGDVNRPNVIPTVWLPLLAGVALGAFQLIPWTPSLADWFAAESRQWRQEFTAPVSSSADDGQAATNSETATASVTSITRSLYSVATREYLALLCLATAVLVLSSLHIVDKQSILWLFTGTAICGAGLSFFGVVQRLSWNGKFYWVFEPLFGGFQSFGPFVNRNNAGGFLNLCLAAALGLLIWVHWSRIDPTEASTRKSSRGRHRSRSRSSGSSSRSRDRRPKESDVPTPPNEVTRDRESAEPQPDAQHQSDEHVPPSTETEAAAETSPVDSDVHPSGSAQHSPPPENTGDPSPENTGGGERSRRGSRSESSGGREKSHSRGHSRRSHRSRAIYPSSYRHAHSNLSVGSIRTSTSGYFGDLNATRLWSIALVVFTAGGVLCTASRGSILAMFAATMATSAALAIRGGNRKYAIGLLLAMVAGVGLMNWAGQAEFVQSRFEDMFAESQYDTGRVPNWMEALKTVPEFWVAGTGLGTYRFVYERFQNRYVRDIAHFHAENQYIQALVEGGVVALLLLIAAISLVVIAIMKLYRTGGATNTALAITGTFALTSQIVGGCFDFGLYIPSNMILMATICGAVVGRAALLSVWPTSVLDSETRSASTYAAPSLREQAAGEALASADPTVVPGSTRSRRAYRSRSSRQPKTPTSSYLVSLRAPTSLVTVIVGILLLGCLFGSLELNKAAKIEAAMRKAPLNRIVDMDDPDEITDVISPLLLALPQRWDDALAHRQLATLFMQLYRAETYQRLLAQQQTTTESSAGDAEPAEIGEETARDEELWRRSSVWHLHGTIHDLLRQGDDESVGILLQQPAVKERLSQALAHVMIARNVACTIPQLHYMLAELAAANDPNSDDQIHLDRARTLAPGDATLWYWTGLLDLNNDRKDAACRSWNHSLTLSDDHLNDIIGSARGKLTLRDLIDKVLPQRSDILLAVIERNFLGEDKTKVRDVFLQRAEEVLEKTDLPPAEMAYVTGSIYRLQGRPSEAAGLLEEAINRDSAQSKWRYEYARLLLDLGDFDGARDQVMILQDEQPKVGRYRRLHNEINEKRHRVGAPVER